MRPEHPMRGNSSSGSNSDDEGEHQTQCCPECGATKLHLRSTIEPRFLCCKCNATFDEPDSRTANRRSHGPGSTSPVGKKLLELDPDEIEITGSDA